MSGLRLLFANIPPCLVGMEACVGAHHLSRKLKGLGHDARLMPAKYVRPYSTGLGFAYSLLDPTNRNEPNRRDKDINCNG